MWRCRRGVTIRYSNCRQPHCEPPHQIAVTAVTGEQAGVHRQSRASIAIHPFIPSGNPGACDPRRSFPPLLLTSRPFPPSIFTFHLLFVAQDRPFIPCKRHGCGCCFPSRVYWLILISSSLPEPLPGYVYIPESSQPRLRHSGAHSCVRLSNEAISPVIRGSLSI